MKFDSKDLLNGFKLVEQVQIVEIFNSRDAGESVNKYKMSNYIIIDSFEIDSESQLKVGDMIDLEFTPIDRFTLKADII